MVLDIGQPQWLRISYQQPEDALAFRPMMDGFDLAAAHPDGDELGEPAAFADHAHRAVAGVDQRDSGVDDAAQQDLEFKARTDRDDGFEQRVNAVSGGQDGLQPDLELV